MKTYITLLYALLMLALPASLSANETATSPFQLAFNNEPVHPGCVMELMSDLCDTLPVTAAIDLEGCQKSNRFSSETVTNNSGKWTWHHDTGSFSYRVLGVTPGGTHVLHTADYGGGSGIFMNLLFVRIEQDTYIENGKFRTRTLLKSLGDYPLGDRADPTIKLDENTLTITPAECRSETVKLVLP
jgi:hypothetical protein